MAWAYGITALISLAMVGVCAAADKKRDVWLMLLFVSVSVCNLGYFMLAVSRDLGSALNSNRIAYLGSVFLPFFLLMMVLRFCGIKAGTPMSVLLVAVGIVMLGITTSPGILPVYYSAVDITVEDGITKLVREYGPLHRLYYLYLLGYLLAMVSTALYAIGRKRIRSPVHTVLLLCAVFCNIAIWLAEQFLPRRFEWLSVSYILTECLILVIYRSMQKQGLLPRDGRTRAYTINVLLAVFLLLLANLIRVVTRNTTQLLYLASHLVVLIIYLGILISWGVSVYDRIVNRSIRRYLMALVGLMMFWMLVRTLRHTVFHYVFPIGQWCWYAFYISMILIPQLCLFAAKHIGQPEGYTLPKKWALMYIPSVLLILGILTNDLHQLAFRFHMGYEAGWNTYQRTVLYYAAVVWIFGCIALMIAEVARRCRVPGSRKTIWLPMGMVGLGVAYTVLYTVDTQLFGFIEVTAALCFTVVAIWESCIKTGLIPSNTHYRELLKYSGLGVAVADQDYTVRYRSDDALQLTREQMRGTETAPLLLEKGILVSSSGIRGGRVLWQEDLSELLALLEELTELREELKDANTVSMRNYQMDRKIRALAEKNRLHDQLHKQTARQIDLLNVWLKQLGETKEEAKKKELLRRIVVVGTYLKRRNNLILVSEQEGLIQEKELELSIREMIKSLRLAGIEAASSVQLPGALPAADAMALADFYEYVVEQTFDGLRFLLARFFRREERIYACMDVVCNLDLTGLQTDRIQVSMTEENCWTLSFRTEGGGTEG